MIAKINYVLVMSIIVGIDTLVSKEVSIPRIGIENYRFLNWVSKQGIKKYQYLNEVSKPGIKKYRSQIHFLIPHFSALTY